MIHTHITTLRQHITLKDIGRLLDHYCSQCRLVDLRDAEQINAYWVRKSLGTVLAKDGLVPTRTHSSHRYLCVYPKIWHKRDAVLHHRRLVIDLLLMEVKSNEVCEYDHDMDMVEQRQWPFLRFFGLIMSDCRVRILEIRYAEGARAIYKISPLSIPAFPREMFRGCRCHPKANRIEAPDRECIAVLQDQGPEPSPPSSQETQAIA